MAWRRKASAPLYANLAEKVGALITGTADAWVLPWFNLVPGNQIMDIEAFCALGPPPEPQIDALDFLSFLPVSKFGAAVGTAQLGEKLADWAFVKLFAAYCELAVATGETCTPFGTYTANIADGRQFVAGTGFAVPAGCHKLQVRIVSWGSGTNDIHLVGYAGGVNIQNPTPDGHSFHPAGYVSQHTWTAELTSIGAYSNATGTVAEFAWCMPGSVEPFVPDDIVQPPTAIPPTPRVYTTIEDLGAELDQIETKLHWVLNYLTPMAVDTWAPMVADELVTPATAEEDIELGPDVTGFVVTVTNIGNQTDERFGEPRQLHKLGRVVMGTGGSWLQPIEITVSPMLVLKPDPSIKFCRVQVYPPATATVTTLVKAPPAG